ncbi:MAG TPA: glycine cleavage system aminomethyltransferase GcvT [Candidatus Dormibacteraeota bacterium]|nr:glycine cleavage system aminomethyltransferase GcvT [Candidatus Dormibacteraeota bacterium]
MTAERTPLYEEHVRLGAQMTNFGGWVMPLQYSSIREEHRAVREAVGLFDLSHMGELRVKDESLAQRVITRDLTRLKPGRIQYAMLCNEAAGIIDDVLAYAMADGGYLLVVNAGNQDADFDWIRSQGGGDSVLNVGREWALIGVQGPRAVGLVQRLTTSELGGVKYYAFIEGKVANVPCLISRTGYTGEDGFELFCGTSDAASLWRTLLDEGQADGVRPAGLGARDTLRLEAGMRLHGNDIDNSTNPLEAGLDWTLSLDKDFIGRDAIMQARERGLSRNLVGFKMLDRSIPRHGYAVVEHGRPVGTVTSGNVSFTLGYNIGMAYVPPALAELGTRIDVDVRGTAAPAEVVALPFYKRPHPK